VVAGLIVVSKLAMSNQVAEELVHELANVEAPTVRRGGKEMVWKAPVVRCG
jgi:hypothetical protein